MVQSNDRPGEFYLFLFSKGIFIFF